GTSHRSISDQMDWASESSEVGQVKEEEEEEGMKEAWAGENEQDEQEAELPSRSSNKGNTPSYSPPADDEQECFFSASSSPAPRQKTPHLQPLSPTPLVDLVESDDDCPAPFTTGEADSIVEEEDEDGDFLGPIPLRPFSASPFSFAVGSVYSDRLDFQAEASKACFHHGFKLVTYRHYTSSAGETVFSMRCSRGRTGGCGCPFVVELSVTISVDEDGAEMER
ncbi:hypothetical protein JCM10207_005760, partial [Rhodosporidiobolus poonsookiae]